MRACRTTSASVPGSKGTGVINGIGDAAFELRAPKAAGAETLRLHAARGNDAGYHTCGMTSAASRAALASPDSKSRYVRRLFSTIADRYDLITVLLSYGQDRRWKRRRRRALSGAGPDTARARPRVRHRRHCVCGGRPRRARRGPRRHAPDAAARAAESAGRGRALRDRRHDGAAVRGRRFDVVTTGYGIRNVPDIAGAIAEMRRVLKPGGTLLSLDFNRPLNPLVRGVYLTYLTAVGSTLGFVLHRDPDTYRYIPESIRRYPGRRRGQRDDPARRVLVERAPAGARRADGDPSREKIGP